MTGSTVSTWEMALIFLSGPVLFLLFRFGLSKSKREEVRDVLSLRKTSSPNAAYWIAVFLRPARKQYLGRAEASVPVLAEGAASGNPP